HAIRERRRGAGIGPPLGAHRRRRLARPARPSAPDVRRGRGAARPVRCHAAASGGLGGESRDQDRGVRSQRQGGGLRHASRRPASVPAAEGRDPHDRRATGRHGLSRHDLLAPRRHARGAGQAALVKRRVLGRTGLAVSPIGFGAWAIGGNRFGNSYGATDDAESRRAVRPAYVRFAVERSLGRLRTDYIDVLQLHNPALGLTANPETYGVLEDLKEEGKIRSYGVSVHTPEEGLAAVEVTRPDTIQIVYNVVRREAEDRFLPAARAANIGISARDPLPNGLLAGKYGPDRAWAGGGVPARP